MDRLANTKSKLLYKETKDNGELRRQVRGLQEQLERFTWGKCKTNLVKKLQH